MEGFLSKTKGSITSISIILFVLILAGCLSFAGCESKNKSVPDENSKLEIAMQSIEKLNKRLDDMDEKIKRIEKEVVGPYVDSFVPFDGGYNMSRIDREESRINQTELKIQDLDFRLNSLKTSYTTPPTYRPYGGAY